MKKSLWSAAVAALIMGSALWGQVITVTTPAGGEQWVRGHTYTIRWTSSGVTGPVDVILRRADAPSAPPVLGIAAATENDGAVGWRIHDNFQPGEYLIRVRTVPESPQAAYDDSEDFTITVAAPGETYNPNCDLALAGVGVEYYNGQVVAWVKNNGPDDINQRIKFKLALGGAPQQIIERWCRMPAGEERRIDLQHLAASDIPEAGLQAQVTIDIQLSHIHDTQRTNNGKVVRLWPGGGGSRDLAIRIADQRVTRVYVADGHPLTQKFRLRATLHLSNNTAYSGTQTTVPCLWRVQSRNTFEPESAWADAFPVPNENTVEHGTLQLGPFRPGEITSRDITIDFLIRDYDAVVYRRILFELDPNHTVNDPNRSNNLAATGRFDAE